MSSSQQITQLFRALLTIKLHQTQLATVDEVTAYAEHFLLFHLPLDVVVCRPSIKNQGVMATCYNLFWYLEGI